MASFPPAGTMGSDVAVAADVLRRGGVVAMPTETVYGLAADASNDEALARVFRIKGRPRAHPLIVHIAEAKELTEYGRDVPAIGLALADRFWPGPLTLIVRRGPRVSLVATGGHDTVGLRVPAHAMARELLRAFGGAVAAPSANRFGRVSPTRAAHVHDDLGADVDYILDGGPCTVGVESTIVDLTRGAPALLRAGGLSRAELAPVLTSFLASSLALAEPAAPAPAAPGTLASHYAPRARVVAVAPEQVAAAVAAHADRRVVVLAPAAAVASLPRHWPTRALPDDPAAMARELYATLRDLDADGYDVIVAALPEQAGLGEAVADRLRRAAGPKDDPDGGAT